MTSNHLDVIVHVRLELGNILMFENRSTTKLTFGSLQFRTLNNYDVNPSRRSGQMKTLLLNCSLYGKFVLLSLNMDEILAKIRWDTHICC